MCLPFEDNKNETYIDKNLILSGWGFTTIGKEERNTGDNCTTLDFYWKNSINFMNGVVLNFDHTSF